MADRANAGTAFGAGDGGRDAGCGVVDDGADESAGAVNEGAVCLGFQGGGWGGCREGGEEEKER